MRRRTRRLGRSARLRQPSVDDRGHGVCHCRSAPWRRAAAARRLRATLGARLRIATQHGRRQKRISFAWPARPRRTRRPGRAQVAWRAGRGVHCRRRVNACLGITHLPRRRRRIARLGATRAGAGRRRALRGRAVALGTRGADALPVHARCDAAVVAVGAGARCGVLLRCAGGHPAPRGAPRAVVRHGAAPAGVCAQRAALLPVSCAAGRAWRRAAAGVHRRGRRHRGRSARVVRPAAARAGDVGRHGAILRQLHAQVL